MIWVVGPDGVGKTSVRHALVASTPAGIHLETDRRALLPRLTKGMVTEPHRQEPYAPLLSILKTLYYYADALLSWRLQVLPAVRRGIWVIRERGWWDMVVDPKRYRLQPHLRLMRFLGRLLPQADLILVLEGPPALIWARKPELSEEEIARQVEAWRRQLPPGQRRTYLDVTLPLEDVVRLASRELEQLVEAASSAPKAGGSGPPRREVQP